jgi:hypothetical protein
VRSPHDEPARLELPATFGELLELVRYPGDSDLETFVWELGERFDALTPPPRQAGLRPVVLDLDKLLVGLVGHFKVEPEPEAMEELRVGLEMADLPFKGQRA